MQPSHIFTEGAVKLLAAMGVEDIVFGSEHADVDFLTLAKNAPDVQLSKKVMQVILKTKSKLLRVLMRTNWK